MCRSHHLQEHLALLATAASTLPITADIPLAEVFAEGTCGFCKLPLFFLPSNPILPCWRQREGVK